MSKRLIRVLSLILTLVMFLSLGTPAFAADPETGAIDPAGEDPAPEEGDSLVDKVTSWAQREVDYPDLRDFDGEECDYFAAFDEESGIAVTVEAPVGVLPMDAEVQVKPVEVESVREAVSTVVEGEPEILLAMDISFSHNGEEIEPQGEVRVKVAAPELDGKENLTLVHIPDAETEKEPETVDLIPQEDLSFELAAYEIVFQADDFSVYAVVDEGEITEDSRLLVRFFHHDTDTTPVYSVYVKPRDKDMLASIIADPEIPQTQGNELFCGWSIGKDYTAEDVDGKHTIDYIRGEVKTLLEDTEHPVEEGDTLDVYAMVFHYFNVAYVDENGETTLNTEAYYSKESSYELEVQLAYAPYLQGYRFYGWQKDDDDETIYMNGDTAELTAATTHFRAQVQQGFWLSFDENPGENNHYKGATYVPPVFCINGVIPEDAEPEDPVLPGYVLGDNRGKWFLTFVEGETADEDSWSNPFTFSGTINQDTTVKAKWTLQDKVNYTIIVWMQNINDDKAAADSAKTYDFAFSSTKQVAPKTPVADLIGNSEADLLRYTQLAGKTITVNGVKHTFAGFSYNETKGVSSTSTEVKADGSTVVNLYYDRNLITITFFTQQFTAVSGTPSTYSGTPVYYIGTSDYGYCPVRYYSSSYNAVYVPTTSNSGTQYADVYGEWHELTYRQSSSGVYGWYYVNSDNKYSKWDGTRYSYYNIVNTSSFTYYTLDWAQSDEWTGLYDQPVSKYEYTWPTNLRWMSESPTGDRFFSLIDCFSVSANLYGVAKELNAFVYHFLQDENGNYSTDENDADFTVKCNSNTDRMVFREFSGFTSDQYRVKLPSGVSTYRLSTSSTLVSGSGNDATYTFTWGSNKTATDYHDGAYWTEWINSDVQVYYSGINEPTDMKYRPAGGKIEFRYSRDQKPITFMYGKFVTGRDVEITSNVPTGQIYQTDPFFFEASVDSYKKDGGENYFDPVAAGIFNDESFLFMGWYTDPGCNTPYDFANKIMLQGGITVYALFKQREYRVFLHPNIPTTLSADERVAWNDPEQSMNFRVSYDDMISDGNPVEGSIVKGQNNDLSYVLVGWYLDEACTIPFRFDTRFTDASTVGVALPYGDAEKADPRYATEDDGTNKDANRPWINRMVILYAKWRKVLPGASGITLVYDAIEAANTVGKTGTFAEETGTPTTWTDPLRYMDKSEAMARTASTPDTVANSDGYQFLYWEILDAQDRPTGKKIYPGTLFEVDAQYAKVTTVSNTPPASGDALDPDLPTEEMSVRRIGQSAELMALETNNLFSDGFESGSFTDRTSASGTLSTNGWTTYKPGSGNNWNRSFSSSYSGYYSARYSYNSSYAADCYLISKAFTVSANAEDVEVSLYESVAGSSYPETFEVFLVKASGITTTGGVVNAQHYPAIASKSYTNTSYELQSGSVTGLAGESVRLVIHCTSVKDMYALYIDDVTVSENINTSKVLTINYVYADGTPAATSHTAEVDIGSEYSVVSPSIEGYTPDHATVSGTMGNNDVTVTVTYTINQYTVTFQDFNNTVLKTQTVTHGGYASAPADPSRNGYTFTGWDPDPTTTPVTSDLIITAQYTRDGFFIVTFKDWNGRVLKTEEVERGHDATAPEAPSRTGFTFKGWDKDFTNVTKDLVVYALYTTNITKQYTVTLRATYGPLTPIKKTHISWYANNGTGAKLQSEEVTINESITIQKPAFDGGNNIFSWDDHVFLGWARLPESDMNGEPITNGNQIDLGSADLFLQYVPASGETPSSFKAMKQSTREGGSTEWVTVKAVAADELMPYHGMYAVWAKVFYVYHSSDNKVERFVIDSASNTYSMTDQGMVVTPMTFDLASRTRDGYLYGGYYKEYSGVSNAYANNELSLAFDARKMAWNAPASAVMLNHFETPDTLTDANGCVPYEGSPRVEVEGKTKVQPVFDISKAYSASNNDKSGLSMVPTAGTVYYLKEVPATQYLLPYLHATYYVGPDTIANMWLVSNIDDGNYKEIGFVVDDQLLPATIAETDLQPYTYGSRASLTLKVKCTTTTTNDPPNDTFIIKPTSAFGETYDITEDTGYITYRKVKTSSVEELTSGQLVMQYWVTLDGVLVTGKDGRVYSNLDQTIQQVSYEVSTVNHLWDFTGKSTEYAYENR